VLQVDFNKYIDKLDCKLQTKEKIKVILLEFVHCIINAFNLKLAN
jgi:hypothetical protein